jgi:D-lactate dehydrogenase
MRGRHPDSRVGIVASSAAETLDQLRSVVRRGRVLHNAARTRPYRTGWRSGGGPALAVVLPANLVEFWRVLEVCVRHDRIVIVQAANTGLTEGSTPSGDDYDREVIIVNTRLLTRVDVLPGGAQVIAMPGATLHQLERILKPLGRTPHSVIGSSCIGASITGGVANSSGGSLVRRGPAYTEYSLYARVDDNGELVLVDRLGLGKAGETPEQILAALDAGQIEHSRIENGARMASDCEYETRVRDIEAETPARYNANEERLCEASGCAGKVAVFALRLDTFLQPEQEKVFYIGTNNPEVLTRLRRDILGTFINLPEVAEYLHRDCFDMADVYGKDTLVLIDRLGTDAIPALFRWKSLLTDWSIRFPLLPDFLPDRLLQWLSRFLPDVLPSRMRDFRNVYEHHLIIKMSDAGIAELREHLQGLASKDNLNEYLAYFECNEREASLALLHRFAAAGAAVRYQVVHRDAVEQVLPLDIALRRDEQNWCAPLPKHVEDRIVGVLNYGHFLCQVFHQDYLVRKGEDPAEVKRTLLEWLDGRDAQYPAEHNVGHLYEAGEVLQDFYRTLDPTNTFNPGIGKMSKLKNYGEPALASKQKTV